jgi:hypothetical protein
VGASPSWKYATLANLAERFGKWHADAHPSSGDANGHDARFWVSDGAAGWTLKHPRLLDLPAPYSPEHPETWPPDMMTVYAERLHDDGRGGRFFA